MRVKARLRMVTDGYSTAGVLVLPLVLYSLVYVSHDVQLGTVDVAHEHQQRQQRRLRGIATLWVLRLHHWLVTEHTEQNVVAIWWRTHVVRSMLIGSELPCQMKPELSIFQQCTHMVLLDIFSSWNHAQR